MRKLGISIYPEKDDSQRIKEYIKAASESGFSRIFHVFYQLMVTKIKSYLNL